jgi:hypothetical protein
MGKLLLLIAIIVVGVLLVRRVVGMMKRPAQETQRPEAEPPAIPEAKLVRCVECGAFVPKAEAVAVPNGFRCGAGCAR